MEPGTTMNDFEFNGHAALLAIQPLFPVSVENSVAVMDILLDNVEPNVPLCSLFLCAVKKMIVSQDASRRKSAKSAKVEEINHISFEELRTSWMSFCACVRYLEQSMWQAGTFTELSTPRDVVLALYEKIENVAVISGRSSDFGGLDSLVRAFSSTSSVKSARDKHWTIDLSEVKIFTLMIAQALQLPNVFLYLSEKRVFLGGGEVDETGSGLIEFSRYEENCLPKFSTKSGNNKSWSSGLPAMKDLWICSGGQLVKCDRFIEVAYLCCELQYPFASGSEKPKETAIAKFQQGVLAVLQPKLEKYPMGLAMYGNLESKFGNAHLAEKLLISAIESNQNFYRNSYVFPYCFYMEHLIRNGRYAAALVAIELASKVASTYVYVNDFDKELYEELYKIAKTDLSTIFHNLGEKVKDPSVACLLLAFMDNICSWEENGTLEIIHSLWLQFMMKELVKVAGCFSHIIFHSSPEVFLASTKDAHPRKQYLQAIIEGLESETTSGGYVEEHLPPDIDAEFCVFALEMYNEWPPLRATRAYVNREYPVYELPKQKSDDPETYEKVMQKFRSYPCGPIQPISQSDLEKMSRFRAVNPLYVETCGMVFPFLDMGPPNIAIPCFDFEKIRRELPVPRPGTREFAMNAAFCKRFYECTGDYYPDAENGNIVGGGSETISQVLLRSRKMQSIQSLLELPKYNSPAIKLALSANASEDSSKRRGRAGVC